MTEITKREFFVDIERFNKMYNMPEYNYPTLDSLRLHNFEKILRDEVKEIDDVYDALQAGQPDIDVLTAQADLYGDIIVYCTSELRRIGIDPAAILQIIMDSNFSKMGEDGKPIYDERGKLLKGPNYWKPEPKIKEYLTQVIENNGGLV